MAFFSQNSPTFAAENQENRNPEPVSLQKLRKTTGFSAEKDKTPLKQTQEKSQFFEKIENNVRWTSEEV